MTIAGLAVGAALSGGLAWSVVAGVRRSRRHRKVYERTARLGHAAPVSLHPRIDEHACICSGNCVTACPEKDVLGMIDGKPKLINPAACIGHGECLRSCPVDAITLVIGSEQRGVELPLLGSDFQTNVPRLYIAGELGGMGLIHNAVNQGCQAMRAIGNSVKTTPRSDGDGDALDALIVGAGPAGLAAALQAKALELRYAIVDQDDLGGALRSFPRQKVVMTAPVDMPLYGRIKLRRTTKEALLELWQQIVQQTEVAIESGVKVSGIVRGADGLFTVETSAGARRARHVLLAIGRRGTPRKLGISGEQLDKVTYNLIEPEQYRGQRCLVVGGGDSAVETALYLSREPGTTVTLAHRGERFDRIKPANQEALDAARAAGGLDVRTATRPVEIAEDCVVLDGPAQKGERVANDFVFVCIGGELPTAWLTKIGVRVKTLRGEAHPAMQS
jgi:thioredoxin reductase/NAD-dependent dihydropyrimidine dehydrogenase PreA subunit